MNRWTGREAILFLCCVLVLGALIAVDLRLGPDQTISASYALAPVLASALLSVRLTAVCAATALSASASSFLWNQGIGEDWLIRLVIAAALCVTSVLIAVSRERRERRLARMTVIAEAAQQAILRAVPSTVGPVGFAARYISAVEEARIGGDLYEVVDTPFGTRAIVGDVKGKGLEAVQLAATVLGAFRRAAPRVTDLVDLADELDAVVSAVAAVEDFVTVVLVQFSGDGSLHVVNIGHMPPLLIDKGPPATVHLLDTGVSVPPLGLHPSPTATVTRWGPGTRLLLYTDGTTESRDRGGHFFELSGAAAALSTGTLDEALDRLIRAVTAHVGHRLTDDVALVLAESRAGSEVT